jgi:hypothetical protein
MKLDISQADAMNNVGSVLPYISTRSPSWMLNWIISELIDFTATSDDYIALFEFLIFVIHVYKSKAFSKELQGKLLIILLHNATEKKFAFMQLFP